jgi:meso-butanediol dehydrogenase / (S,S)-butanediol dehydrogenase / diacetyl reductase
MTELQRYNGMTALITGRGTGIGAEVARRLAQEGANVVLMGRRREPLEAMAREFGGMVVVGDAANTSDVKQAIAAVHDALRADRHPDCQCRRPWRGPHLRNFG